MTETRNTADLEALAESVAPETKKPEEMAWIRERYQDDPTIPKLARRLGLSTEAFLARLGRQTEPTFHVAPDYSRAADQAALQRHAGRAFAKRRFERGVGCDGRDDGELDTLRSPKRAPLEGTQKGIIAGPAGAGLRNALIKSWLRRG